MVVKFQKDKTRKGETVAYYTQSTELYSPTVNKLDNEATSMPLLVLVWAFPAVAVLDDKVWIP